MPSGGPHLSALDLAGRDDGGLGLSGGRLGLSGCRLRVKRKKGEKRVTVFQKFVVRFRKTASSPSRQTDCFTHDTVAKRIGAS